MVFCQDCWVSAYATDLYNDTGNTVSMLKIYFSKIHEFMIQKSYDAV